MMELLSELQRCSELFNSQVFVSRSIFTQSAFLELLVRLNYVLQELKKIGKLHHLGSKKAGYWELIS